VNGIRQLGVGRLADEQVNVLRQYDVSVDTQGELTARVLQTLNEEVEQLGSREVWLAVITTEGDEWDCPESWKRCRPRVMRPTYTMW